jgi:hypothetical protein
MLDDASLYSLHSLNKISTLLTTNLFELSLPKNDPSTITKFFPDYKTQDMLFGLEL